MNDATRSTCRGMRLGIGPDPGGALGVGGHGEGFDKTHVKLVNANRGGSGILDAVLGVGPCWWPRVGTMAKGKLWGALD
jgi:hypothetical protein